MKFSIFIILLFFSLSYARNHNRVILDKTLHKFRQEYREYRWVTKVLSDKSFFEIYNTVGAELKITQKMMEDISDFWGKWSLKFNETSLEFLASERTRMLNENIKDLLIGASKIYQKGLNELFSGDLMTPSPPMEYLEDLFDEIEFHIEDVWEFYSNNSNCVAPMFKNFLPLFDPIVEEILKLGKTTKENVLKNDFKKSQKIALEAKKYVELFTEKMDNCVNTQDVDTCVVKVIKKETECHAFCGKLYSSIRSAIWSTALAVEKVLSEYKANLKLIGDTDVYAKKKVSQWIEIIKEKCDVTGN